MKLITEDAVRDLLRRLYNRPDEEIEEAVAHLRGYEGLVHPEPVGDEATLGVFLTASFASLDRCYAMMREALALAEGDADQAFGPSAEDRARAMAAAQRKQAEAESRAMKLAIGSVFELGRAVVYALADVSFSAEQREEVGRR